MQALGGSRQALLETPVAVGSGRTLGGAGSSWTFRPLPANQDIAIGGMLVMPPVGTDYRRPPGILGTYRLNLGGSIGLHGTLDSASIGRPATHGCMRLGDEAIEWLYRNVPLGTKVFIY